MKSPQEYVDVLDQFTARNLRAVKIDGATREDAACLTMVAYLRELPVEVLVKQKLVVLRRTDAPKD